MIIVVGYKDGKEMRHESCSDVFSADAKADEFKDCILYDEVRIVYTGDDNVA